MGLYTDLQMFRRFAGGLGTFLREPLQAGQGKALIRSLLARRRENFLTVLREAVYGNSASPYRALLRRAGLTYADAADMVQKDGIETTLKAWGAAGVFVTLDEFKGRCAIRRPGYEQKPRKGQFDNPIRTGEFPVTSGGTRGPAARLSVDFEILTLEAAQLQLLHAAWNIADRPLAMWWTVPPGSAGIKNALRLAKFGYRTERWFSQTSLHWRSSGLRAQVFTRFALWRSRRLGRPLPLPELVTLDKAGRVASWLAEQRREGRPGVLLCPVGAAIRVCRAARENGLDISGTVFRCAGESLTPARAALLRKSGCQAMTTYSATESGFIGLPCPHGQQPDSVHLLQDKLALIIAPASGPAAEDNAFYLTSLHPSAPRVLLNVEIGDCGRLEPGPCGCALEQIGYQTRIGAIRSYEKLSGEGITLSGSDLIDLVEMRLPARFGGEATDYQFVEDHVDPEAGISLRVSPRLGPVDEEQLRQTVLDFLARGQGAASLAADIWRRGGGLQITRAEPLTTPSSKIQPLHVRTT